MQAIVRRIGSSGTALTGRAESGHWVPMDTSAAGGGQDGANSPMELLLLAVGGCTAMDVLTILAKKRVKLDDLEVGLEADRSESHPKIFTGIRLVYRFFGDALVPGDLEQAVSLSQDKYCSVAAMVRGVAPIVHTIEIHPARAAK